MPVFLIALFLSLSCGKEKNNEYVDEDSKNTVKQDKKEEENKYLLIFIKDNKQTTSKHL